MRWNFGLMACGVLMLAASAVVAADAVRWTGDFGQACEAAAQQNRLVLLHFYSDNCAPCVRVDKEVFSQPQVAQAIERYCVPVKVHVEQTPELARKYNIQRWPTDVLVTPAGLEVYRTVSPRSPGEYLTMVEQVALHAGARPSAGGQVPIGAAPPAQTSQYPGPYQGGPVTGTFQSQLPANDRNPYQSSIGQSTHANLDIQRTPFGTAPGQPNNSPPDVAPTGNPMGSLTPATQPQASPYTAAPEAAGSRYFQPQVQQQPNPPPATAAPYGSVPASYGSVPPAQQGPQQPVINRYTQQGASDYGAPAATAPPAGNAPWVMQGGSAPPAAAVAPAITASTGATAAAGPYSMQPPFAAAAQAPTAPPAAAQQRTMVPSASAPPVVLEGCCAVSMVETRRLKKADPQFGAIHRGRTYLFIGAEEQARFLADPDRYAVILSGYDPVRFAKTGELVEGKRQFGMMYQQKIYLMADEDSLNQFTASPQFFSTSAHQAMLKSETSGTQFR